MNRFNSLFTTIVVLCTGCLFGASPEITPIGPENNLNNINNTTCECPEPGPFEEVECLVGGSCQFTCVPEAFLCDDLGECLSIDDIAACGCAPDECELTADEPNGSVVCNGSECGLECNEGFEDENGVVADGCETCVAIEFDFPGDGFDTDCDGIDGKKDSMIFVDEQAVAPGDGSPESPFTSLASAIEELRNDKLIVAVRGDVTEPIAVQDLVGISIVGGYDETWHAVTNSIVSPEFAPAIRLINAPETVIQNFFVRVEAPISEVVPVAITVVVFDSTATFVNVDIFAPIVETILPNGTDGVDGEPGANGMNSSDGGFGGGINNDPKRGGDGGAAVPCPAGFAENGMPSLAGVSGGSPGRNRCQSVNSAMRGGVGGTGPPGDPGREAVLNTKHFTIVNGTIRRSDQTRGERGLDGVGGGGGGGGGTNEEEPGGMGAGGGEGGHAGTGGEAGQTGISSIGIVVLNSTILTESVEIQGGLATDGSRGGSGGCGGRGGTGGSVSGGDVSGDAERGGPGGNGSHGGNGSSGFGGNGGHAFGVVLIQSTLEGDFDYVDGTPGTAPPPTPARTCPTNIDVLGAPRARDGVSNKLFEIGEE